LGTSCVVNWARYKTVRIKARIVVGREENQAAVKERVLQRLVQTINPLPTPVSATGWPFGQALRASDVYNIALAEPGVRWVDQVRLLVEEVPARDVTTLAADYFQPQTWYAGSGVTLFRSLNDGEGWEPAGRFPNDPISLVRPHPFRAGWVAVVTRRPNGGGSSLHVSSDCGEGWETVGRLAFNVRDLAWAARSELPVMLLATDKGLYEFTLRPGGSPVQLVVDPTNQDQGFYAVAVAMDVRGTVSVAVSAQNLGGVFLSSNEGKSGTFRRIGLQGEDIRQLAVQYDGPRAFLWGGAAAAGTDDLGKGCFRLELRGAEDAPEGWQVFGQKWEGGSCWGIAFLGGRVLAASHRQGVLQLEPGREVVWQAPDVRCGLPLRDPRRFQPVAAVATNPQGSLVMAGGVEGVYQSQDKGTKYSFISGAEFLEKVTLADTWLFVSGQHDVIVVNEDEAK
ncbi:MAG: putative baseplate assembly protein, partial [Chloroflexota bacterium]